MKKKVRVQPTVPFYTNEPAVSKKLMADSTMTPNPVIGSKSPKVVDKNPARMSGMAGFVSKAKPAAKPSGITIPKLGTKSSFPTQGKLRVSGNSSAHRIGFKSKI